MDILQKYGAAGQALTITLAGLNNNAARQSTAVNESEALVHDELVQVRVKTGASGVSGTGTVLIYVYGSVDGGTTFTDGLSGTNGAVTVTDASHMKLVALMNTIANSTTYVSHPFAVASAFGGRLPQRWGVVVRNLSGAAFDPNEASHAVLRQGIAYQMP